MIACLLFPSIALAQFSGDYQFSIISGVTSNWSAGYVVGSNTVSDVLIIENGGVLTAGASYVGYETNGNNNLVFVNGSGSLWTSHDITIGLSGSGNVLSIENGGQVSCTFGTIGYNSSSSNNLVIVSGSNSVFSGASIGGGYGSGNQLVVTNGGRVSNQGSPSVGSGCKVTVADGGQYISHGTFCYGSTVIVTGTGSMWNDSDALFRMYGASTVTIGNGGQLIVPDSFGGVELFYSPGNQLTIAEGGTLTTGRLWVQNGVVSIRGTVNTGSLSLTSTSGSVSFTAGLLTTPSVSANNGIPFLVGNGTNAATLQLTGSPSTFSDGLHISSNGVLTACMTGSHSISGAVVIEPGGTVLSECGRTLTFTGTVTNNGTIRAINNSVLQTTGTLVNNGVIDIINGKADFQGAFINNGLVFTNENEVQISSVARSGSDIVVQIQSVSNASYQLQVSPSLTPAAWTNLGASQSGAGGVLIFTDSGGATNGPARFYQVKITAP
jgi:T5SS/PEP-CTERM-associated repeat protein